MAPRRKRRRETCERCATPYPLQREVRALADEGVRELFLELLREHVLIVDHNFPDRKLSLDLDLHVLTFELICDKFPKVLQDISPLALRLQSHAICRHFGALHHGANVQVPDARKMLAHELAQHVLPALLTIIVRK